MIVLTWIVSTDGNVKENFYHKSSNSFPKVASRQKCKNTMHLQTWFLGFLEQIIEQAVSDKRVYPDVLILQN